MAVQMGKTGRGSVADINMTPMIDVLLVLLVIFMVVQPLLQRSIDIQVPEQEESESTAPAPRIVLDIDAAGVYRINSEPVPADRLEERLRGIYAERAEKILFVQAAPAVVYQDVITAMDAARGAGVEVLGAMLE